jgi:plastocyanin
MDIAAAARKPVTHTVIIDGSRFEPETLSVMAGDTVVWVNKDVVATPRPRNQVHSTRASSRPASRQRRQTVFARL